MDISTFRWVLIIVGIAIIAGIYLFGIRDNKRKPRASRKRVHARRVRQEPALDAGQAGEDENGDGSGVMQAELAIDDTQENMFRVDPRFDGDIEPAKDNRPKTPSGPPPEMIVTLFLQARDRHLISGVQLLDASLKSGLIFGSHDIFHRIHEEDVEPIFSMANLIKPGTFDKTAWNTMEVKGVTMFMTLPGPRNALDAWDSMLATSRRLAELLHADLLDDSHSVFTRQRSMQIKEELREFERKRSPE